MPEEQSNSLWPQSIKAGVLAPGVILKGQAEALAQQTGGVLTASVRRDYVKYDGREFDQLTFIVSAPAIGYEAPIITLMHTKGLPYPLIIEAELYGLFGKYAMSELKRLADFGMLPDDIVKKPVYVSSSNALLSRLTDVFKSPQVVALAESLIARVSEEVGV